jgi:glyoxylase-like metal-dependent hydrolase (beta-lactamase superfamily II)
MSDSLHTIDCEYVQRDLACAYLRVSGDECAFIETNTAHAVPRLLAALAAQGRSPADVRYVIVTHVHLDHAGGAHALMARCPNATLLAHPRAARHLIDPAKLVAGATAVYGAAHFAELYGTIRGVDAARVRALDDGAEVPFGAGALRFIHTRGHANHHFVVHDPALDTVFTGDAFGLVYPQLQRAGLIAFPSTSPTDFDGPAAHAAVDRILALGTRSACLTHFGEQTRQRDIAAQLHDWLTLSEALVEASRERPEAEREAFIEARLTAAFDETAARAGLSLGAADRTLVALDRRLNVQGLAFAAGRPRA